MELQSSDHITHYGSGFQPRSPQQRASTSLFSSRPVASLPTRSPLALRPGEYVRLGSEDELVQG